MFRIICFPLISYCLIIIEHKQKKERESERYDSINKAGDKIVWNNLASRRREMQQKLSYMKRKKIKIL
jgi:hypothetical protein